MSSASINSGFETQGIRANRQKEFPVVFTGDRWYRLLRLFETRAEQSAEFSEISEWVTAAIEVRRQLKQRGF